RSHTATALPPLLSLRSAGTKSLPISSFARPLSSVLSGRFIKNSRGDMRFKAQVFWYTRRQLNLITLGYLRTHICVFFMQKGWLPCQKTSNSLAASMGDDLRLVGLSHTNSSGGRRGIC
ncbi:hypothetical protein ACHAW6_000961, partial [Cyclotella cf. meneghiniana]